MRLASDNFWCPDSGSYGPEPLFERCGLVPCRAGGKPVGVGGLFYFAGAGACRVSDSKRTARFRQPAARRSAGRRAGTILPIADALFGAAGPADRTGGFLCSAAAIGGSGLFAAFSFPVEFYAIGDGGLSIVSIAPETGPRLKSRGEDDIIESFKKREGLPSKKKLHPCYPMYRNPDAMWAGSSTAS